MSENRADFGEEFEFSYEELKDCFAGEAYVQDYIDETEDGYLISVYKPIYDSNGTVVAVLGCDYDAYHVLESLNDSTKQLMLIAAAVLVVGVLVLCLVINTMLRGLKQVEEKVYELVSNEGDLTRKLEIKSRDELQSIAENINELLAYIRGIMISISDNSMKLDSSSGTIVRKLS